MKNKILVLLLLMVLTQVSLHGQTLLYNIKLNEELMGKMSAVKKGNKEKSYQIESNIKVEKMISVEMYYLIRSEFDKKGLVKSTAKETANGKEYMNTETTRQTEGYAVKTLKEQSQIKGRQIAYNLCMIYFQEPIGVSEVWSDSFGEFFKIKPAGKNRYELLLPGGKSSFYSYYKGICTSVETDMPFGKLTFTLTGK